MKSLTLMALCIASLTATSSLWAWGERGHDLVTRVAVQNLRLITGDNPDVMTPLLKRDHMLSHLSNVPDIVWRSSVMSEQARKDNGPTHYIGLEKIYTSPETIEDLDLSYTSFKSTVEEHTTGTSQDVGTVPWRIQQLYSLMVSDLKSAHKGAEKKLQIKAINQALLHAGLMSHFVADLANPHHTTVNHDGQLTGNTGLHAYFENDIVNELSFTLAEQIYQRSDTVLNLIIEGYSPSNQEKILNNPQRLVLALTLNSHQNLDQLMDLDNRFSLLEKSTDSTQKAKRKPASDVTDEYQGFIVERLALGSAVLARLWQLAWLEANKPDLSSYQSGWYPVQAEFIELNYQ